MTTFDTYLPLVNIVGFSANAVLFWKRGWSDDTKRLMELYKNQIEALENDNKLTRGRSHELGNQVQQITLEIGILKGKLAEKETKNEEYVAILQNRNPELQSVLEEIRDFMKIIHEQSNINQKRNVAIDKATDQDKGHVMRKQPSK